ncbi:probable CTP synthase [Phialocephala subalpina]|uniref:CTP synthase n=1 Tax=Phialocephala subalpina TaxID=576137 RepID=A0A1L7X676_9HELO|nr:probable CTP synthase [Phialocephala subalpina]
MKYVLVSGGVISGVGKGIIASSTGLLLKTMGLKVTMIKIDPYMNVDAGTMAPTEHGEVFVLDDGGETDLDLGNYERYLNITLTRDNNITTGKIYQHVIERERRGDYLGKTVQIVPHLTNALQDWIERVAKVPVDDTNEEPDICVIELGGTCGDIENAPFIEALRQLRYRIGKGNFLHIFVSYVPVINEEQKTKPTQQAIKEVQKLGLHPDLIACRCKKVLLQATTNKVAMFCQVEPEQVVAVHDVSSVYHVPMLLEQQGIKTSLSKILNLDELKLSVEQVLRGANTWTSWKSSTMQGDLQKNVTIALVGKYTSFEDSYISVIKALEHSAMACKRKLNLVMVNASHLEDYAKEDSPAEHDKAWEVLHTADGILVPVGFGTRGTEGMIAATKWARENKKPFLGVCLGMQIAVIEYARNVCKLEGASSVELDANTPHPVVIFMPEIDRTNLGGTMRLGIRPTHFQAGSEWSKLHALYLKSSSTDSSPSSLTHPSEELIVKERHRHRYEVNPSYISTLSSNGLHFVGKDDKGERMEILELKDHPWFVGVQFHPEYLSRVLEPSIPFLGFVASSAACLDTVMRDLESESRRSVDV